MQVTSVADGRIDLYLVTVLGGVAPGQWSVALTRFGIQERVEGYIIVLLHEEVYAVTRNSEGRSGRDLIRQSCGVPTTLQTVRCAAANA